MIELRNIWHDGKPDYVFSMNVHCQCGMNCGSIDKRELLTRNIEFECKKCGLEFSVAANDDAKRKTLYMIDRVKEYEKCAKRLVELSEQFDEYTYGRKK